MASPLSCLALDVESCVATSVVVLVGDWAVDAGADVAGGVDEAGEGVLTAFSGKAAVTTRNENITAIT
jgi:hypothetical protein